MKNKIKVIQIMPEFGLAGAEVMAENLSVNLFENGYDVKVVSLYNYRSSITKRIEERNIPIFYLGKKKGFDIRIIKRLYKLFKKEKPDIIHTHRYIMPYAVLAAYFAGVPLKVHTVHNIAKKEVGNIQRKINKFLYKFLKVIPVAISPLVKESVIKEYAFSNEKVPMVYNGIDLKKCMPKNQIVKKDDKIIILHIGRFSEQKNHEGLIESFKIVHENYPNSILKLIGSGDKKELIQEKVKRLGLEYNVEFLGLQSDVYPHLNQADIFVLPSLWEGMPITIIEAMTTGLPIVASRVGGVPDMFEHNRSGILTSLDIESISCALLALVRSSKLRESLGQEAQKRSKLFTAENMGKDYEKIYLDGLNNSNKFPK